MDIEDPPTTLGKKTSRRSRRKLSSRGYPQEKVCEIVSLVGLVNISSHGGQRLLAQQDGQDQLSPGMTARDLRKARTSLYPNQLHSSLCYQRLLRLTPSQLRSTRIHQRPNLNHLILPPLARRILQRSDQHSSSPIFPKRHPFIPLAATLQYGLLHSWHTRTVRFSKSPV